MNTETHNYKKGIIDFQIKRVMREINTLTALAEAGMPITRGQRSAIYHMATQKLAPIYWHDSED
jgi:hypothetical protein